MVAASALDAAIADRIQLFLHRVPEELYDLRSDPNARNNLIQEASVGEHLRACRQQLLRYMAETEDPAHEAFLYRGSEVHRQRFLTSCTHRLGGS